MPELTDQECFCAGDTGCLCDYLYGDANITFNGDVLGELKKAVIFEFEDRFNPAHFYCRLRELGIDKNAALTLSNQYLDLYNTIKLYIPVEVKTEPSTR